jgi:hypothetical protein
MRPARFIKIILRQIESQSDKVKRQMASTLARLELSRAQILGFRRKVGSLDERLPAGAKSLRLAAWAGLQDSVPRAALFSIHARVAGTSSGDWEHPSLVQLWVRVFTRTLLRPRILPYSRSGACRTALPDAQGRAIPRTGSTHF